MRIFPALLFFLLILISSARAGSPGDTVVVLVSASEEFPPVIGKRNWKVKFTERLKMKYGEDNKVVSAVLAFPVFGIVGLHRIYLGTKPYVPVVYIATLGGCAGILPLIDFCAILAADKETFETYRNNPRVFMWAK